MQELESLLNDGTLLEVLTDKERSVWEKRITNVVSDPNNQFIPRVENAGRIVRGCLVMHNGLRIHPLSYYSRPMLQLLATNRGVHEPEEERAFSIALQMLPKNAVMMELGCYWAFYSIWFMRENIGGLAYLSEPDLGNLSWGLRNLKLNRMTAKYEQAYIGKAKKITDDGFLVTTVGDLATENGLEKIDILHCDIQGFEHDMLEGAQELLKDKRISFVFISTHSNELHALCVDTLSAHEYRILRDTDLDKTFCFDGVIVACSPCIDAERFTQLWTSTLSPA